jgi:ATP-dependent protease ClpP protease subunit
LEEKKEEEVKVLHEKETKEETKEENKEDLVMARLYITDFDDKMIGNVIELSLIEGRKQIYMNSPGGLASAANILIDVINQTPEEFVIKTTEQIMSAGFLTILNVKCPIEDISTNMSFHTIFLHHDGSRGSRPPKHVRDLDKLTDKMVYNQIEHVLTDKQKKYYSRCHILYAILPFMRKWIKEDLFLTSAQMKELLGDRYSVQER